MRNSQRWGMGIGISLMGVLVLGSVGVGLFMYAPPSGASATTIDAQRQAVLEVAKRELGTWLHAVSPREYGLYGLDGVDLANVEALTPIPRIFANVDELHVTRSDIEKLLADPPSVWMVPLASKGHLLLILLASFGSDGTTAKIDGIGFAPVAARLQRGLQVLNAQDPKNWGPLRYLYFGTPAVDVLLQKQGDRWVWVYLKRPTEGGATRLDDTGINALLTMCARARQQDAEAMKAMRAMEPK